MIFDAVADFLEHLPEGGVLIGLDIGTKTIGTAFCDAGWTFASPADLIRRIRSCVNDCDAAASGVDGLIVVAPEYAGMVPPRLVNFLLLCSGEEVGHKPALAVGVSATRGGTYPIAQLRASSTKNNHMCWLPDHLILREARAVDTPDALTGTGYVARYAKYCIKLLGAYAKSLKEVRCAGIIDHGSFPYGM